MIFHPLNKPKRKGVKFEWGPEQQNAFDTFKTILSGNLILKLPDFAKPLIVHSDRDSTWSIPFLRRRFVAGRFRVPTPS